MNYENNSKIIKAISDPNRLEIIDILSCGERCACDILKNFKFTQPTLSHHMKVLIDCEIVNVRKEGSWNYYCLNINKCNNLILFLMNIIANTDDCICNDKTKYECK
ncbi:metalloregulator ArsR/SmtB family transcription factor [Clostridium sp. ZBS15]|uniref:ArsR/SmtB family transcription factor n=1 Tax=Clostridium sp. ZBS15 TaxID=2949969 RepID=UPI002079D7ED|nr:metalloregulator ArsR/SmtB family transcription factor [Clostridium sp. ZBS15]